MQLLLQGKTVADLKDELFKAAMAFGAMTDENQPELPLTSPTKEVTKEEEVKEPAKKGRPPKAKAAAPKTKKTATKAAPAKEEVAETEAVLTVEDVSASLRELNGAFDIKKVSEVLKLFGAARSRDVKEEDYAQIIQTCADLREAK